MLITLNQFLDTIPVTTVEVDSALGLKIGLTSEVFVPASQCSDDYPYGTQLYRNSDSIYIQAIEVWTHERKRNHFNTLLSTLWDLGFTIKVPNPVRLMEMILLRKGFEKIEEEDRNSSTPDVQVVYCKQPPIRHVW